MNDAERGKLVADLIIALRNCCQVIEEVVRQDDENHPIIQTQAKVAAAGRAVLARVHVKLERSV